MWLGKSRKYLGTLVVACVLVTGCTSNNAATPNYEAMDQDPLEPFNRAVYQFNYTVDGAVLRPATVVYREIVPEKGRELVTNFLDNLYTPVVFANSVLQLDPENSFASFWKFMLNSSVGIGGIFNVAAETDLKVRHADFGQTLAIYGMDSGPYVVLPIIGPCNGRDTVGRIGDAFMNPFNYVDTGASIAMWTATAIDKRSTNMKLLDDIYGSSLDPYATFRSGYTQKRVEDIRRAKAARAKAIEKALSQ